MGKAGQGAILWEKPGRGSVAAIKKGGEGESGQEAGQWGQLWGWGGPWEREGSGPRRALTCGWGRVWLGQGEVGRSSPPAQCGPALTPPRSESSRDRLEEAAGHQGHWVSQGRGAGLPLRPSLLPPCPPGARHGEGPVTGPLV